MEAERVKEILSFFAYGDKYSGLKLKDKNFTEEELSELRNREYINRIDLNPPRYLITIKGSRHLRDGDENNR